MKKPIHLYIFVVLSSINCLLRLFNTFFSRYDEEAIRQLVNNFGNLEGIDESMFSYMRAAAEFQTNVVNKAFAVLLFAVLLAVIVLLFRKKNEQASYAYLGYLFGTLLLSTYIFIGGRGLAQVYTDPIMRQAVEAQTLLSYGIAIALFAVYFGVTIFFHLRKPKDKPSTATNATDI